MCGDIIDNLPIMLGAQLVAAKAAAIAVRCLFEAVAPLTATVRAHRFFFFGISGEIGGIHLAGAESGV